MIGQFTLQALLGLFYTVFRNAHHGCDFALRKLQFHDCCQSHVASGKIGILFFQISEKSTIYILEPLLETLPIIISQNCCITQFFQHFNSRRFLNFFFFQGIVKAGLQLIYYSFRSISLSVKLVSFFILCHFWSFDQQFFRFTNVVHWRKHNQRR